MKKSIFLLLALCLNISAFCNDGIEPNAFQSRYLKAKELYEQERYGPAKKVFEQLVSNFNDGYNHLELNTLSRYYIALCNYALKDKNTSNVIDDFLRDYPDHKLSEKLRFTKGKYKFDRKKYRASIQLFSMVDEKQLNNEELLELHFKRGYAHFYFKEFQNALTHFIEIRDIPSKYYYPCNYYIAYISYYNKDYDEALNSFYRVNVSKLYKKVVPYYIAQIYFIKGQYDKVIDYAMPLLKNPNFKYALETTYLVGKSYFNTEDYHEALPYLRDYIKNAPKLIPTDIYNLGYSYYKVNNHTKAIKWLKQISDNKDSLSQNANYIIANAFLAENKQRDARAAFYKTKQINEDASLTEVAAYNHAKMSYELKLYEPAITDMTAFLDTYSESAYQKEGKELLSQMFIYTNNYQNAINVIESIEKPSPAVEEAYQRVCYLRAIELYKSNDASSSIKYFKKSLIQPLDKNLNASTYYWLGEVSYLNKRYKEAQDYFNRFLEIYPLANNLPINERPSFAYYALAYTYYRSGSFKDALVYFEKSISAFKTYSEEEKRNKLYLKTYPDVLLRAADCNFLVKNYRESMAYYSELIDGNYSDRDYAIFQTAILYGLGGNANPKKKIETLKVLLKDYSWSMYADDASFELGDTYFNNNQLDNAIDQFNKTIKDFGGSNYHRKALLKLALINYNKEDLISAESYCKNLLDQFPNSDETKEVVHILKDIYIQNGDPDGFLKLNESYSGINLSLEAQDSIMYYAAENQYIQQSCQKAIELFTKYLDHYPLGYFALNAHYYKAQCLLNDGQHQAAINNLEFVLEQGGSKYKETALTQLASIYHHENEDWTKALQLYSQLYIGTSNKTNKTKAIEGIIAANYNLKDYKNCLVYCEQLISDSSLNISNDAWLLYVMGQSYLNLNNLDTAYIYLDSLSKNHDIEQAVEGKYWMAYINFQKGEYETAKTQCFDFISNESSEEYWRVKSFILLADLFAIEKNNYQAKATLESILDNYDGEDLRQIAKVKLDSIISEEQKEALPIIPKDSLINEPFIVEDSSIYMEYDTIIMNNGDTILIETEIEKDAE
tara:strand:- start:211 stop:3411 length:3201 start_codon:yes stop_codon:yes gene_type:complete